MKSGTLIPVVIMLLCVVNGVLSFMDSDWSETFMAITAVLGWTTVWEYRKKFS